MLRPLLYRWSAHLPARYIDHPNGPYLERYLVATVMGLRIYLHRFVASDPDGLHSHPFRHSFSLILAGRYREYRWSGSRTLRWFNYLGPDALHRIELMDGADVWTLFVHSPRRQSWGRFHPLPGCRSWDDFEHQQFRVASAPGGDPPLSDWSGRPPGAQLRREREIPCGANAYAAGLLSREDTEVRGSS